MFGHASGQTRAGEVFERNRSRAPGGQGQARRRLGRSGIERVHQDALGQVSLQGQLSLAHRHDRHRVVLGDATSCLGLEPIGSQLLTPEAGRAIHSQDADAATGGYVGQGLRDRVLLAAPAASPPARRLPSRGGFASLSLRRLVQANVDRRGDGLIDGKLALAHLEHEGWRPPHEPDR